MSTDLIDIRADGGVAMVTLNAPATRNALSTPMIEALWDMHLRLESMKDVRVTVLSGAGGAFCAGGSLDEISNCSGEFSAADLEQARQLNLQGVHKIPRAVCGLAMPTIAAVNGAAIGGRCDLALMCDIRIASTQAIFAELFFRVGLMPGDRFAEIGRQKRPSQVRKPRTHRTRENRRTAGCLPLYPADRRRA